MLDDRILPYLPEGVEQFREQLKHFPVGYEKWVYAASLPDKIFQGDMFSAVLFVCIDENGNVANDELAGMVISNTCDVQPERSEFVLIAPIIDLEEYKKHSDLTGKALEEHVSALKENRLSQLMYLPGRAEVSPSFVDFGQIWPMSLNYFHDQVAKKRTLSFSQGGHYMMLIKLAHHLCRAEAVEAKRQ